jgi:hypothetical protein
MATIGRPGGRNNKICSGQLDSFFDEGLAGSIKSKAASRRASEKCFEGIAIKRHWNLNLWSARVLVMREELSSRGSNPLPARDLKLFTGGWTRAFFSDRGCFSAASLFPVAEGVIMLLKCVEQFGDGHGTH